LICEKIDFHIVIVTVFGFNNRSISAVENSDFDRTLLGTQKLNPEMSLTAFLKTHYDHPVKDGDYGKDQKLPFVIHSAPLTLIFTIHQLYFEAKAEISDHYNLIKFLQKMKIFVTKDLQDPSGNRRNLCPYNSI
jgi:hypothetical protein